MEQGKNGRGSKGILYVIWNRLPCPEVFNCKDIPHLGDSASD